MTLASFVSPSTDRWYESNFVSFLQLDGFSFWHVLQVFCECGGFHHFFRMGIFSDHFFHHLLDVAILREFQFHHFRPRRFTARSKEPHVHLHRFRRRCGQSWPSCNCTTRALFSPGWPPVRTPLEGFTRLVWMRTRLETTCFITSQETGSRTSVPFQTSKRPLVGTQGTRDGRACTSLCMDRTWMHAWTQVLFPSFVNSSENRSWSVPLLQ